MKIYLYVLVLIVVVSSFFISCGSSSSPIDDEGDTAVIINSDTNDSKITWGLFNGTAAGSLLTGHLRTGMDYTVGAARRERVSLMHLRNQSVELQNQMAAEAVAAYYRLEEVEYFKRWYTVHLLSELENENALDILSGIALSTLPIEKNTAPVPDGALIVANSRKSEIKIRLAAVRGLVKLIKEGQTQAEDLLLKVAKESPLRSVKTQAIHNYLMAPVISRTILFKSIEDYRQSQMYQDRLTILRRQLPSAVHYMFDIKPISWDNVPTPNEVKSVKTTRGGDSNEK